MKNHASRQSSRKAPGGRAGQVSTATTGAQRKKAVVALARRLALDLWRIRTGRAKPKTLGLELAA